MIGETKLDFSFPDKQFFIKSYNKPPQKKKKTFLRNSRQLTKPRIPMDIQIMIFELNLRKIWLVVSAYKPPAQGSTYFLNWLSQIIDFYSITQEKQVTRLF